MGGLASRPSVPTPQPQVVFVPAQGQAPAAQQTSSDAAPLENDPAADAPVSEEVQQAEQREGNLLRRSRGRFGTVLTGFRGLLSSASAAPRKTLLGE